MNRFRCALIGADSLLVECGKVLLERGHSVVTIAAGSERIAQWGAEVGAQISTANPPTWANDLKDLAVDYLFAITHLELLPAPLIAAPRAMAINFHDGPLPEFRGRNTPAWGLLQGAPEWGVTWHRIDDGVDTGDVLVERRFAIAERETSLSLNTRNFEHGLESFSELLDLVEAGRLVPIKQPGNAASAIFRSFDKPDGILDFTRAAVDVDRVIRALHFGPHPNPLAAAVLWHPCAAFVVDASEVVDGEAQPGTVLAADGALTIACAHSAVRLSGLRRVDGTPTTVAEFLRCTGLAVGAVIAQLTEQQRQSLAQGSVADHRHEPTTVAQLRALHPASFPWPTRRPSHAPAPAKVTVPLPVSATAEQLVAALAALLRRFEPDGGLHVALAGPAVAEFTRPLVVTTTAYHLADDPPKQPTAAWFRDVVARYPDLAQRTEFGDGLALPLGLRRSANDDELAHCLVVLQPTRDAWEIAFDPEAIDATDAEAFARALAATLAALPPRAPELMPPDVHRQVVETWNATGVPFERACIHDLIARQAAATPDRRAVVWADQSMTYRDLAQRADRLARHLQQLGVGPDSLVGIAVERSADLVVAVLGVLTAGGAYVPLDPSYPADRLRYMIADSDVRVVICSQTTRDQLPIPPDGVDRTVVMVDTSPADEHVVVTSDVQPENLAYCIYTSGSSGQPKAVLVEHASVANLFAAMDANITRGTHDVWGAVTSLAFDISIVELLYTLARGFEVVLLANDAQQGRSARAAMQFSLFYFAADDASAARDVAGGSYRLLLEGARFADRHGFCAVWTPERHFHQFGGLYPNPAITAAAIAAVTERIGVRAGSVVLPLHHPAEVAESWSMIDNLSNGRVGVSFASGWQPNDFVLRPQNFGRGKQELLADIELVRRLWRGDTVEFAGPDGTPVAVTTLPRPIQRELPVWITTAGTLASFAAAGSAGAHLLTHLVGQTVDELATKIVAYRAARAEAGHDPATGVVTLMVHTFVGENEHEVRATVREPLRNYLASSYELLREHAWSFPTFRRKDGTPVERAADLADEDMATLAGDDLEAVLDFAAARYYDTSGLFGTVEQAAAIVSRFHQAGVDEIACLIDFGVPDDNVLASLPHLVAVRERAAAAAPSTPSLAELVSTTPVTHLQCTPSMARLLTLEPATRATLGGIEQLFVGGEALPADLARDLASLVRGTVTNMYGPTETTVWSSSWPVLPNFDFVAIGTPLANTQMYVLDSTGQPTPPGVIGELWIGGAGVARGYHRRPELTSERFRTNPFHGGRMYRTGDLARWRRGPDDTGVLEFLGRADQQVKLRGHRLELGEIEAELTRLPEVADSVAVVTGDDADQQLVAFVVAAAPGGADPRQLLSALRARLPAATLPNRVVVLPRLPRTLNGKVDRRALASLGLRPEANPTTPPNSDVQRQILSCWLHVLSLEAGQIGVDDNFFDVGGHSLLIVRLQRRLQDELGRSIALTDLYRYPTVRAFADSLAAGQLPGSSSAVAAGQGRAAQRRARSRSGS